MQLKAKRWLTVGLLGACMALMSGCVNVQSGVTINSDGSVNDKTSMSFNQSMQGLLGDTQPFEEEMKELKTRGYDVKEIPRGFEATKHYNSFTELVNSGAKIYNPSDANKWVRYKEGIIYDTYELNLEGPKGNGSEDDSTNEMAKAILQSAKVDYRLNLPYPVDSANATSISSDRKQLVWDLKQSVFEGKDFPIQAKFRVIHEERLLGLEIADAVLLVIGIGVFVFGVTRPKNLPSAKRYMGIGIVCVGVSIAGFAYGYYVYHNPPTLTEADTISKQSTDDVANEVSKEAQKVEKTESEQTQKQATSTSADPRLVMLVNELMKGEAELKSFADNINSGRITASNFDMNRADSYYHDLEGKQGTIEQLDEKTKKDIYYLNNLQVQRFHAMLDGLQGNTSRYTEGSKMYDEFYAKLNQFKAEHNIP